MCKFSFLFFQHDYQKETSVVAVPRASRTFLDVDYESDEDEDEDYFPEKVKIMLFVLFDSILFSSILFSRWHFSLISVIALLPVANITLVRLSMILFRGLLEKHAEGSLSS